MLWRIRAIYLNLHVSIGSLLYVQIPTTEVVELLLKDCYLAAISLLNEALAAMFFAALRSALIVCPHDLHLKTD